jgi:hypothetical protein
MSLRGIDTLDSLFTMEARKTLECLRSSRNVLGMLMEAFVFDPTTDQVGRKRRKDDRHKSMARVEEDVDMKQRKEESGETEVCEPSVMCVLKAVWDGNASSRLQQIERAGKAPAAPARFALIELMREPFALLLQIPSSPLVDQAVQACLKMPLEPSSMEVARLVGCVSENLNALFREHKVESLPQSFGVAFRGLERSAWGSSVAKRLRDKLCGKDYETDALSVEDHVQKIVEAATSEANLARMYEGWSAFI